MGAMIYEDEMELISELKLLSFSLNMHEVFFQYPDEPESLIKKEHPQLRMFDMRLDFGCYHSIKAR